MRWHILAIGKPKLAYAKAGLNEYAERLKGYAQMNPPIRDAHHRAALWAGLANGADGGGADSASFCAM